MDTLFLPFQTTQLPWPAASPLFLRARLGTPMRSPECAKLLCEQSFKPDADALQTAGFKLQDSNATDTHSLVLVLPPRQRDEARALLARAVSLTQPGGRVVACLSNNEGARSGEADLEKLVGPVTSLSKHKCRVFWSAPLESQVNQSLLAEWLQLDAPRTISDPRFVSRPGVFAWNRIDPASQLLAQHLPPGLSGHAADLGAGFGYLSVELLNRCAGITALDLFEAEARALQLAEHNLRDYRGRAQLSFNWQDVTQGLTQQYDLIISNLPFHTQSRADRPDIGRRFISVAAAALQPGGQLWLVANRHLPYEEILNSNFGLTRIVAQQDGFKIIAATKASNKASKPSMHTKPRR
ncbi:MAG: class I SAM-dependent methyltransferase [Steroidobacteraceae bacterium]